MSSSPTGAAGRRRSRTPLASASAAPSKSCGRRSRRHTMSKPVPVEDATFDQKVLKSDKPVLVDFWATWCRPCLMVAPIIDELSDEYDGKITFLKLDVDHNP